MEVVRDAGRLRDRLAGWRSAGERIALVPTMGNLHAGHLQLVERAHQVADRVVVSIFVNPMQFSAGEDYDGYPRTPEQDHWRLEAAHVDLLFAPEVDVLYPGGTAATSRVEVPGVGQGLEDDFRPGFFIGVATVVARLFNLVQPDCALFGEKDYQQLAVIHRMVVDLCWPIEILGVPTVREADGLAMSSRNQYLTAAERERAPLLFQTLQRVAEQIRSGSAHYAALQDEAMQRLTQAGFRPDYISIREAETLQPAAQGVSRCVVLAAVWLGRARLIDNLVV
jgi:pantoate--beta-alanine ligase